MNKREYERLRYQRKRQDPMWVLRRAITRQMRRPEPEDVFCKVCGEQIDLLPGFHPAMRYCPGECHVIGRREMQRVAAARRRGTRVSFSPLTSYLVRPCGFCGNPLGDVPSRSGQHLRYHPGICKRMILRYNGAVWARNNRNKQKERVDGTQSPNTTESRRNAPVAK